MSLKTEFKLRSASSFRKEYKLRKYGEQKYWLPFLGALAKLLKATINFVMCICLSVRPSVRMKQLGSHRTDF